MNEIELFNEQVKGYQIISPEEAEALIAAKAGHLIFVGRETCPYCRKFSSTLTTLIGAHPITVNFLHSRLDETLEAVNQLRDKYEIPTVPGLVYSDQTGVRVKCDSSMSVEEILAFIKG